MNIPTDHLDKDGALNGHAKPEVVIRPPQLLVIDDEQDIGRFLSEAAKIAKYECKITTTAQEFIDAFTLDIAVIMIDLIMPGTDGIELLRFLGAKKCTAAIVLMSGFDKRVMRVTEALAAEHGLRVVASLEKPFRLAEVLDLLEQHATLPAEASVARPSVDMVVTTDELQRAVEKDEFVLHYQPQVEIETGKIVGLEALVRWQRPHYGLIYPDHFIGIAEASGLIERLTERIVKRAFVERREYAMSHPDLSLSVNISAKSLNDLMFPDVISDVVNAHSVPPSNLVLEITESGLIDNLTRSLDVLSRLRVKGMCMSIDDFGTGYSMLQQLRRVPATELKIDKSFVQDMHRDAGARALVNKTIELGHELDMTVVAEGVETEEQLVYLRERGCDVAQGYLFSRPIPINRLVAWMKSRASTMRSSP